jgi:hypothetical protein
MLRTEVQEELLRNFLRDKKGMSDSKITYFLREFELLSEMDKSNVIYEAVGKEVYKTNPVDIDTFITDPDYLGSVYDNIFKIWRDLVR